MKAETPAETFEAAEEGMARVKTARILLKYRSGAMGESMYTYILVIDALLLARALFFSRVMTFIFFACLHRKPDSP